MCRKKMGYRSTSLFIICCFAAIVCHSMTSQQPGVHLLWQGVQYPNNSLLNIEFIGEGERALSCRTDKRPCCRYSQYRIGEWYYPNGTTVPIMGVGAPFYRNRSDEGLVLLHRRYHYTTDPTGLYCCVLPDSSDTFHTLCIGLLPKYSLYIGGDAIIGLSYNAMNFTLSCVTSGGIATFVDGDNCLSPKQELVGYSQQLLDPLATRYNTALTWNSQSQGNYICSTRSTTAISYAVLLTEFGAGQGSCSSQIVGMLGCELTLLCLANEPVTSAVWTTPRGMRNSNNITFTHLSSSDAGVYTCRGTVRDQEISSSVNLSISRCNAVVYVTGNSRIGIGKTFSVTCNISQLSESSCVEDEFYIFNESRLTSRNKTSTFRADSVSGVLNKFYSCVVTLNGSNFTSNPARITTLIELPTPLVSISSDMDNPIPHGSSPTLSCTVSLSPAVDIEVEIVTEWSGPTYGLREYTTTEPVLNSSAEVPTYISTATLNAPGTFYDSGQYSCSVVINPLNNHNIIQSTSAIDSQGISVLFLYPRRPVLDSINRIGLNWIYISWNRNNAADNVTEYEVEYFYAGECSEINNDIITETVGGSNSSYNITGLGEYLNYSIALTAINDTRTGRSPPNIKFAVTLPTTPTEPPQAFVAAMEFSTNITVRWQRVRCSERRSEITHYILQYSLEDSDRVTEESVPGTSDSDRMYTANRLQLLSAYTFTIAAVNRAGQRGPNTTISAMTSAPESVPFQLQLSGVHSCLQWRISDPEDKIHDVMIGIASGVNQQCPYCELEYTNITNSEFQCFPGSPNQVTFRAKVHDRAQATAREVITHIEEWTISSDVVTLPVHHARLRINSSCIALLATFDDPECPGYLIPPSQPVHTTSSSTTDKMTSDSDSLNKLTTTAQSIISSLGSTGDTLPPVDTKQPQFDAGAIVGGAVAIVLIICITTGVVMIAMFLLYSVFKLKYIHNMKQSTPKKPAESAHEITTPAKAVAATKVEAQDTESPDEMYEVVEMQVTSSAKTRYAPAQTPQEGTVNKTQPVESEASKDSAAKGENQGAYVNID